MGHKRIGTYDLDLSGLRDVIGYAAIRFVIGHFLLVLWTLGYKWPKWHMANRTA